MSMKHLTMWLFENAIIEKLTCVIYVNNVNRNLVQLYNILRDVVERNIDIF